MKLITWNVNGIRAAYKKGLIEFIEREDPDILCVQETKATPEQCEPLLLTAAGRVSHWSSSVKRKGYSGVATFARSEPKSVAKGIGIADYDDEGRVIVTEHEDFSLYNIYFPNGGSGDERHSFKQHFLRDLSLHLGPKIQKGERIIVVGDYNVAYMDIDVFDPKRLSNESGFLPEERQWMNEFLQMGFVDCYRHFHAQEKDKYTWWDMRTMARPGNRGWRIDHVCVTKNLVPRLKSAEILDWQQGSDHCPVVVEL